ncbi:MAG: low specificity L-threonine aldolase [Bacteroidales bacterium]|nr:low specificity L-threonine aldolase [Bacteroidales bacterium]
MRSFGSDNHSGICPEILKAIADANADHALAYGDDEYTQRLTARIRTHFGETASPYLVFNGTGANMLCIDAMCRSHEAVVCAETAHINVDECGAPQRIVGCRLLTVDTPDGKLTPALVRTRLHGFGFQHHSQPRAISITQPTELGTCYTLDEIRALADLAHEYNMYLHIDGARLANAAATLNCSLRALTTDAGADCMSLGGTKNGLLMGECAVILNPELDNQLPYRRKQMAQLGSKMRYMAAQMDRYLQDDLWRRNAEHSNAMAQRLYQAVKDLPGIRIVYPVEANSVFVQLARPIWTKLQEDYFFYDWIEDDNIVRWMCSFDTTQEDIDLFVAKLQSLLKEQ